VIYTLYYIVIVPHNGDDTPQDCTYTVYGDWHSVANIVNMLRADKGKGKGKVRPRISNEGTQGE